MEQQIDVSLSLPKINKKLKKEKDSCCVSSWCKQNPCPHKLHRLSARKPQFLSQCKMAGSWLPQSWRTDLAGASPLQLWTHSWSQEWSGGARWRSSLSCPPTGVSGGHMPQAPATSWEAQTKGLSQQSLALPQPGEERRPCRRREESDTADSPLGNGRKLQAKPRTSSSVRPTGHQHGDTPGPGPRATLGLDASC